MATTTRKQGADSLSASKNNPIPPEGLGKHEKRRLTLEELLDLHKHWDQILATKENLFVPLSFAVIPAAIISWKDLSALLVSISAVASILLYCYYLLVTQRFRGLILRVRRELEQEASNWQQLTHYNERLRLVWQRVYLLIGLGLIWVALIIAKL